MLDRYVVFVSDRQQAQYLEQNTPTNLSEIEALHEVSKIYMGKTEATNTKGCPSWRQQISF